ncbi:uncharacterized protein FFB20_00846 [Fusarium fujikuroi]|nr:uncharacterized protein FFB20_00846 [Fusarium fujikuroi]SCN70600.1 uncharacterized protein FFE2_02049 [Fusarium fujikuroi]SCO14538.1 uncharacterized protein FFM5_10875 [Fusarium fujikuroi]SCO14824.1 uncharacterized protein FFC1_12285 [Fusarium fujikuroi]SCO57305.1 uncharacterized protein FFMR_14461 [Fusarium fujikuroi]
MSLSKDLTTYYNSLMFWLRGKFLTFEVADLAFAAILLRLPIALNHIVAD